jgi:hypothetical protein
MRAIAREKRCRTLQDASVKTWTKMSFAVGQNLALKVGLGDVESKKLRRRLRALAGIAHERELS